jgi:hypothetical protein
VIYFEIRTDGLDTLSQDLREFDYRVFNVEPVALAIADVIATQNMAARMAGLDQDGYPFQELSLNTWKRHPDRGPGPPLAGHEMASRIINGFETEVVMMGLGSADVVGHWPSMDDFIIYHITGTIHMPSRDPAGVTPAGWAAVGDAFDDWLAGLPGVL